MHFNKKDIIKNLLQNKLSREERKMLHDSDLVNKHFLKQWDELEEVILSDRPDKDILWERIRKKTIDKHRTKKLKYYKTYSIAASILLFIIGIGSLLYISLFDDKNKRDAIYIVSSGARCIDSVTLSDGSQVTIGPNSRLTYPQKFCGHNREITLSGQGFFDIARDEKHPFIVHTAQMKIAVLGTSFEAYNYDTEIVVETILVNGKIKVTFPDLKDTINMSKNEKLTFNKIDKTIKVETVDADKYSSWRKQGSLLFENENLTVIIPRLKQWFGSEIECENIETDNYRFTFKIKDESIEQILFMIGKSSPIKYKQEGGKYKLYIMNSIS